MTPLDHTLRLLWENGEKDEAAARSLVEFALMSLRAAFMPKSMGITAEKVLAIKVLRLFIHELQLDVLKDDPKLYGIYQLVFARANTSGLKLRQMAYDDGKLRFNRDFYIDWMNECKKAGQMDKLKEVADLARLNLPKIEQDEEFCFITKSVPADLNNTCALFVKKRRSMVSCLAERKIVCEFATNNNKQKLMARQTIIDGNSAEEFQAAKLADTYEDDDMDISIAAEQPATTIPRSSINFNDPTNAINELSPIIEDFEKSTSLNDAKTPKLGITRPMVDLVSPCRAPSDPKKLCAEIKLEHKKLGSQSPGQSFTTKITREAENIFSETVTFGAKKPKQLDFDDEPEIYAEAPVESKFEIFCDNEKSMALPAVASDRIERKPFTVLNSQDLANLTLDISEPTVAGTWKTTRTGEKIFTSSPIVGKTQNLSDTLFMELVGCQDEKNMDQEEEENVWKIPNQTTSAFSRRRSVFTGRASLIGRTSLSGTYNIDAEQKEFEALIATKAKKPDVAIINPTEESPKVDLNSTGVGLPDEKVTSQLNPWSTEVRRTIMESFQDTNVHQISENCSQLRINSVFKVSGEEFSVDRLLGEGGFAKVYRAKTEEGLTVALKYEVPSCAWEAYILQCVHARIPTSERPGIMKIDDMYIFKNASLLVNEYLPMGNLLQCINSAGECSYSVVLFIFIQLARILKTIHVAKIIHGDVKPDNVMFIEKLPEGVTLKADDILSSSTKIRLIDWGRAIDLGSLPPGTTFRGRAGTKCFDCPEMLDNRPWTYQTDCFAFAASLHVALFKLYGNVVKDVNGYSFEKRVPRRRPEAGTIHEVFQQMLNIKSCDEIPSWDTIIDNLSSTFRTNFHSTQWLDGAKRYNAAIDHFSNHQ